MTPFNRNFIDVNFWFKLKENKIILLIFREIWNEIRVNTERYKQTSFIMKIIQPSKSFLFIIKYFIIQLKKTWLWPLFLYKYSKCIKYLAQRNLSEYTSWYFPQINRHIHGYVREGVLYQQIFLCYGKLYWGLSESAF